MSHHGYPMPIVAEKIARKASAEKLHGLRKNSEHKEKSGNIVNKDGRHKSGRPRTVASSGQGALPL